MKPTTRVNSRVLFVSSFDVEAFAEEVAEHAAEQIAEIRFRRRRLVAGFRQFLRSEDVLALSAAMALR